MRSTLRILLICLSSAIGLVSLAQSPQSFNYQGVARDASGSLLGGQSIGLQISLLSGSINGSVVYTETHTVTTNDQGLFNVSVGSGTIVSGSLVNVSWGGASHFMKVEMDANGGTAYQHMGTSQLLSVPYALYAESSGTAGPTGPQGPTGADGVSTVVLGSVASSTDLPFAGNTIGNAYTTQDTGHLWVWDGASWVDAGQFHGPTGATGPTGPSDFTILKDVDEDTKVQVEESLDEDVIRFDVDGTERWVMTEGRLEPFNSGSSVFIGAGAGGSDDLSENGNVAIGDSALHLNTAGDRNAALGKEALYSNTEGTRNTASGYQALRYNTEGTRNTADGYQALFSNETGIRNTASGYISLFSNQLGSRNSAFGSEAMYWSTEGQDNSAFGFRSLYANTVGSENIASGAFSMQNNTEGSANVAIGFGALSANTTGWGNTAVGYTALFSGTDYENSTALGYGAQPDASNTIRLGNSSVETIGGYDNWTNVSSDRRIKTDVQENVPGLDFVLKLRPVTYHLDMDAIARFNQTPDSLRLWEAERLKAAELQTGFIAQEVEEAAKAVDYDFHGLKRPKNENSHYGLRYAEFVVPLVKAMQEQQQLIRDQQRQIDQLRSMITQLSGDLI